MTRHQKKLVESWLVLGALLLFLIIFEDADWDTSWAILPAVVYLVFNSKILNEWAPINKRFMEIYLQNKKVRIWVFVSCCILITIALTILVAGLNPLPYLGFGSLLLIVSLPLFPVLVLSQYALYKELGK